LSPLRQQQQQQAEGGSAVVGSSRSTTTNNVMFGFSKLILCLAANGKLFALDSTDGHLVWTRYHRAKKSRATAAGAAVSDESSVRVVVTREKSFRDQAPEIAVIARSSSSETSTVVVTWVNAYTGDTILEGTFDNGASLTLQPFNPSTLQPFTPLPLHPARSSECDHARRPVPGLDAAAPARRHGRPHAGISRRSGQQCLLGRLIHAEGRLERQFLLFGHGPADANVERVRLARRQAGGSGGCPTPCAGNVVARLP
jgi:hypothetical protein